jgi:hypothetical protein
MIRLLTFGVLVLLACPCFAANESIGFAYVDGNYVLDGSTMRGNGTLFEGATLELSDAPARLQLGHGARVWLGPGSRMRVYRDRLLLTKGLSQIEGSAEYALETRAIRVLASSPGSLVRLQLEDDGGAVVMPVRGLAEVTNPRGVRVGNIPAGRAVKFTEHAGDPRSRALQGCLYRQDQQYLVTDETTNVTFRLEGRALQPELGHVIQLTGLARSAADLAQTVVVTDLRRVGAAACPAPESASAVLVAVATSTAPAPQPQAPNPELSIVILKGNGEINKLRERILSEPIVQVEDRNRRPVAGAVVTFKAPDSGPGATFANGARTLTVTTDAQGRAVARGFKPNREAGAFQISVAASFAGLSAQASIAQTNVLGAPAARGGAIGLGTKVAIIGGVAAAATVGGLAASGAIFSSGAPETPASR